MSTKGPCDIAMLVSMCIALMTSCPLANLSTNTLVTEWFMIALIAFIFKWLVGMSMQVVQLHLSLCDVTLYVCMIVMKASATTTKLYTFEKSAKIFAEAKVSKAMYFIVAM